MHEHGPPALHMPLATPPTQVGSVLHCGLAAQSMQVQGSPASHVPFASPPMQVG